jgi:secondary thiamine-phosphate synthase enzyme
MGGMKCFQREFELQARPRGFHLVTEEIIRAIPELSRIQAGFLQVFLQHTSASLCLNENADPEVRVDFESHFNRAVPEKAVYQHSNEGSDDMPAHLKNAVLGASVLIPIRDGRLALGTWQGIYLGEHRDQGGRRRVIVTVMGQ